MLRFSKCIQLKCFVSWDNNGKNSYNDIHLNLSLWHVNITSELLLLQDCLDILTSVHLSCCLFRHSLRIIDNCYNRKRRKHLELLWSCTDEFSNQFSFLFLNLISTSEMLIIFNWSEKRQISSIRILYTQRFIHINSCSIFIEI